MVSLKAFNLWGEVTQVESKTGRLTCKLFFVGSWEPFSSIMGWQANAVRRRRWRPIKPPEEPTRRMHQLIMLSWFIALVSGLPKADRGTSFAPSVDEVCLPKRTPDTSWGLTSIGPTARYENFQSAHAPSCGFDAWNLRSRHAFPFRHILLR